MMTIVDAWGQIPTDRFSKQSWLASLKRWTGASDDALRPDVTRTLKAMDKAGVAITLLSAWSSPSGPLVTNEELLEQVDAAPERFRGVIAPDLRDSMGAVREIRDLAQHPQVVGVRVLPWLWDLPPNDRRYYPIYVACIEAGLPFCTQIGHTGPLLRSETGRLIPYLEDVLIDFPELTVVGGHVGAPWIGEVALLMHKFQNFYADTSAYALHRLPPDFVALMRGRTRNRILFGSNWPMLSPSRCLEHLDALELDDETQTLFLGGNAKRVFNL